ncbi:hypothetical protein FRB99_003355 [Tulasnella sp. 403]|nr:hypothetical protein FRB99_003355 [Tulasnella sp. 403]
MLGLVSLVSVFAGIIQAVPAPQATTSIPVFDPVHTICLTPVFTGTPPTIEAITPGTTVTGLLLADGKPELHAAMNMQPYPIPGDGAVILNKSGLGSRLVFENGTIGAYEGHCTPHYLNIGSSAYSYKPLTWSGDQNVDIWDADFKKLEVAKASMASSTFLAYKTISKSAATEGRIALYLQTGSEVPRTSLCAETQLKISRNTLVEVGTTS